MMMLKNLPVVGGLFKGGSGGVRIVRENLDMKMIDTMKKNDRDEMNTDVTNEKMTTGIKK